MPIWRKHQFHLIVPKEISNPEVTNKKRFKERITENLGRNLVNHINNFGFGKLIPSFPNFFTFLLVSGPFPKNVYFQNRSKYDHLQSNAKRTSGICSNRTHCSKKGSTINYFIMHRFQYIKFRYKVIFWGTWLYLS